MKILETERLILRTWREADIEPYLAINQDPKVFEWGLGIPMARERVETFIADMNKGFATDRFSAFAVEEKSSGNLIGYVGLCRVPWESHFTPAIEIGWRLASSSWGKGYATEAARAVLQYGFEVLKLDEVVSFTSPLNVRSQRVMEKIGMTRDMKGDFNHPRLAADHRLLQHGLYRIRRP
ncbi:MAG: hypothetical protein QG632_237 [Candidatus Dependentiae bacterium]|nr:hypothetical protein [Candidatus Dependentiae bacterium]